MWMSIVQTMHDTNAWFIIEVDEPVSRNAYTAENSIHDNWRLWNHDEVEYENVQI